MRRNKLEQTMDKLMHETPVSKKPRNLRKELWAVLDCEVWKTQNYSRSDVKEIVSYILSELNWL